MLVQQSQLLQKMEQRLANLEARDQLLASSAATPTPPMQAPVAPAATSAVIPPMQAPATLANNPAPYTHPAKDLFERIKTSEVPKFDGKKEVEAWIIEFKKYCRLLKLRSNEDILLAAGIAMIDEADYWWERQEANLTTWEQAKEAVLRVYGDRNKQRNSVTKIKNLQQGSRTISAFFTEADTLNIYAQCKWGSGLLKSRLCFLTSKNHKQDYKQRGTTTWG